MQIVNQQGVRRALKGDDTSLASMILIFATGAVAWGALGYLAIRCLTQFGPGLFH
ncbi:hypothetical protein [Caulobacter sp. Root343]|uniref:hypothetical protein n=1 Tax=Caulobacter sp. Root343 TaxID=1736520 RepID=UPI000B117BA8|nr:hypothetical protein [Caulobacter sp. Root343]